MNVAEVLERVEGKLAAHGAGASAGDRLAALRGVREQLAGQLDAARQLLARLDGMGLGRDTVPEALPLAQRLAGTVEALLAEVRDAPERLALLEERLADFQAEHEALEAELDAATERLRESLRPAPLPAYYRLAGRLEPFRDAWDRAQRADADLLRMLPEGEITAGLLAGVQRLQAERAEAAEALRQLIPAEVRSFLERAADGPLALSDVSPEVLAWLHATGAARSIQVVVR